MTSLPTRTVRTRTVRPVRPPTPTLPARLLWPVRLARPVRPALLAVLLLLAVGGCRQITNPTADVELQQSLWDLEDLLVQMRDETALLQDQVDSLGRIVARQDTLLRQVAMRSGIPLP